MKSVTLSQVVRSQQSYRLANRVQSWRELAALALTLSVGLVGIALLLMTLDPGAPLAWIIVPVLLGGTVPLFAALPGQFDVLTRFDAAHFLNNVEANLQAMGYAVDQAASAHDGRCRCYRRRAHLFHWKESTLTLSVHDHAITIAGPMPALRQLQHRLGA